MWQGLSVGAKSRTRPWVFLPTSELCPGPVCFLRVFPLPAALLPPPPPEGISTLEGRQPGRARGRSGLTLRLGCKPWLFAPLWEGPANKHVVAGPWGSPESPCNAHSWGGS